MKRMSIISPISLLLGTAIMIFAVAFFSTSSFAAGPISITNPNHIDTVCHDRLIFTPAEIADSTEDYNYTLHKCSDAARKGMYEFDNVTWSEAYCVVKWKKTNFLFFEGFFESGEGAWCYSTEREARNFANSETGNESTGGTNNYVNSESSAGYGAVDALTCPDTAFFGDICKAGADPDNVIPRLIIVILNWALVGVGTVVIIFIIIGGIMYMTAAGSQERAKNGVTMIRNAILGLVLYLVMITVLNFLIPGGLFSGS